jgi:nitroreductase
MDLPVASWYPAVFVRRSRRSFASVPLEMDDIARLKDVCRDFRPFPGVRAEFIDRRPDHVLRGIVGRYGKIQGALCYIAFIGDGREPCVAEGIGYTGEGLILEATARGLATCWVSGFFRPSAVRQDLVLSDDERIFAVTPVGRAERKMTPKDTFYRIAAGSNRRKPLARIVEGEIAQPWQSQALEAARVAPSASNRQPWRFIVGQRSLTVRTTSARERRRFPRRLDGGIAMLHIELGAAAAGVRGTWTPLAPPDVARFEPTEPG